MKVNYYADFNFFELSEQYKYWKLEEEYNHSVKQFKIDEMFRNFNDLSKTMQRFYESEKFDKIKEVLKAQQEQINTWKRLGVLQQFILSVYKQHRYLGFSIKDIVPLIKIYYFNSLYFENENDKLHNQKVLELGNLCDYRIPKAEVRKTASKKELTAARVTIFNSIQRLKYNHGLYMFDDRFHQVIRSILTENFKECVNLT